MSTTTLGQQASIDAILAEIVANHPSVSTSVFAVTETTLLWFEAGIALSSVSLPELKLSRGNGLQILRSLRLRRLAEAW
jgi:hypothetical protein